MFVYLHTCVYIYSMLYIYISYICIYIYIYTQLKHIYTFIFAHTYEGFLKWKYARSMVLSILPPNDEPKKQTAITDGVSFTRALSHIGHSARVGSIHIHFRQRRSTIVGPVLATNIMVKYQSYSDIVVVIRK